MYNQSHGPMKPIEALIITQVHSIMKEIHYIARHYKLENYWCKIFGDIGSNIHPEFYLGAFT